MSRRCDCSPRKRSLVDVPYSRPCVVVRFSPRYIATGILRIARNLSIALAVRSLERLTSVYPFLRLVSIASPRIRMTFFAREAVYRFSIDDDDRDTGQSPSEIFSPCSPFLDGDSHAAHGTVEVSSAFYVFVVYTCTGRSRANPCTLKVHSVNPRNVRCEKLYFRRKTLS